MQSDLLNAAEAGQDEEVGRLLAFSRWRARADASDKIGQTALMRAAGKGHAAVVSRLLEVEAVDANRGDFRGNTALVKAV